MRSKGRWRLEEENPSLANRQSPLLSVTQGCPTGLTPWKEAETEDGRHP